MLIDDVVLGFGLAAAYGPILYALGVFGLACAVVAWPH